MPSTTLTPLGLLHPAWAVRNWEREKKRRTKRRYVKFQWILPPSWGFVGGHGWKTWSKTGGREARRDEKSTSGKIFLKNFIVFTFFFNYFFIFLRKLLLRYFPLAENLLNFRSCICHTRHPVITGSSTVLLFWAQPDCSTYKNSSIFHIANWNCQERKCCKHMHRGLLLGWGEMIKLSYSSVPNHWSFGVGALSLTRNPEITSMPTLQSPLLLLLLVRIISSGEVG